MAVPRDLNEASAPHVVDHMVRTDSCCLYAACLTQPTWHCMQDGRMNAVEHLRPLPQAVAPCRLSRESKMSEGQELVS